MKTKEKRGFTLMELLVVIAIIGILTGLVFTSITGARMKARDVRRQTDLKQLPTAQENYNSEVGQYFSAAAQAGVPAIGTSLSEIHDPRCPGGVCIAGAVDYSWLDNTQDIDCDDDSLDLLANQWFCAYAQLEGLSSCSSTAYFAASQKGIKVICDDAPTVTASCTCF